MRRALYEKIAEVVTASIRTGQPGNLAVHLPIGIVPGGFHHFLQDDRGPDLALATVQFLNRAVGSNL